jgi:hypothetical protein
MPRPVTRRRSARAIVKTRIASARKLCPLVSEHSCSFFQDELSESWSVGQELISLFLGRGLFLIGVTRVLPRARPIEPDVLLRARRNSTDALQRSMGPTHSSCGPLLKPDQTHDLQLAELPPGTNSRSVHDGLRPHARRASDHVRR